MIWSKLVKQDDQSESWTDPGMKKQGHRCPLWTGLGADRVPEATATI